MALTKSDHHEIFKKMREKSTIDEQKRREIKSYLEKTLGYPIRDKKIAALGVNPLYHDQPKRLIEVGKYYSDLEPGSPSEQVIAIFETKLFCVCTESRGCLQGLPYFFTRDTVYEVIEDK
ncbi:MAG: hypothetical protein V3V99_09340 [candidate division Zixibacteria bacterium]